MLATLEKELTLPPLSPSPTPRAQALAMSHLEEEATDRIQTVLGDIQGYPHPWGPTDTAFHTRLKDKAHWTQQSNWDLSTLHYKGQGVQNCRGSLQPEP